MKRTQQPVRLRLFRNTGTDKCRRVLSVNNLAKLTSMSFLKLKETGGLDFHTVPVMLETINLPEVETVNGSIIMEANMETPPTGSFVPQRNDVLQAFGGMDKLTTIKGQIKIKKFHGTQTTSRLEQNHHTWKHHAGLS